jgi:hypothetical protein
MSELTLQQRADNLFSYVTGEKVKGKLEATIAEYNENKDNPHVLCDVKDAFNGLSFHIGEILAKAKEIQHLAEMDHQQAFNSEYERLRCEVNETTGNRYSVDDAKYKARMLIAPFLLTHIFSERGYNYVYGYYQTCKSYRDSCVQKISLLKEELFSSRQQV